MSADMEKVQAVIEATFNTLVNKLVASKTGNCYSDLYVQVDAESGELLVYDENDVMIEKVTISEEGSDGERFIQQVSATLKEVLSALVAKKVFDNPCFLKPFSVTLVDENMSVIEELLFLDDEFLRLDDPLLKDLDADLDDFLAKLFSDVK